MTDKRHEPLLPLSHTHGPIHGVHAAAPGTPLTHTSFISHGSRSGALTHTVCLQGARSGKHLLELRGTVHVQHVSIRLAVTSDGRECLGRDGQSLPGCHLRSGDALGPQRGPHLRQRCQRSHSRCTSSCASWALAVPAVPWLCQLYPGGGWLLLQCFNTMLQDNDIRNSSGVCRRRLPVLSLERSMHNEWAGI